MSLEDAHPQYRQYFDLWQLCRDAQAGQETVVGHRTKYLKPTRGMEIDGMNEGQLGLRRYNAYLSRALFPEVFADTINTLVGTLNRKPASIQLPAALEPMRDRATILGESLEDLLRKIHEQQLLAGRLGIHLDVPETVVQRAGMLPLISIFNAESVRNWDDGEILDPTRQMLNMVVLDASEYVRDGFTWRYVTKYRVLQLGTLDDNEATGVYSNGLFEEGEAFVEADMTAPLLRGQTLDEIPFVFIGARDINIMPDLPPLLGLANRSFAIYRGEADHRQMLHQSAEETLVIVGSMQSEEGEGTVIRTGTGAHIHLVEGGDAKYIGPESRALQSHENNLNRDYEVANTLSAKLARQGRQVESGDALRIRVAAQTANLSTVSGSAAAGLEQILKIAAKWVGADPEEVIVEGNQNFADDPLPFSELNDMMTFKNSGGVISHTTMNEIMVNRDITPRTLEEEIAKIQEEEGLIPDSIANLVAMDAAGARDDPFAEDEDEGTGGNPALAPSDDA